MFHPWLDKSTWPSLPVLPVLPVPAVNLTIIRRRRRSRFSRRYWLEAGILTTLPGALEDALVQAFADRLGELVEAPPPLG